MNVLILGANSDVAESLCAVLASQGHNLALAGRSKEKLEALKNDLEVRFNVNSSVNIFDAEDANSGITVYESLEIKPDWVVCAFGVLIDQEEANQSAELAYLSYMVNFLAPVAILDHIARDMEVRNSGVIVGISSVAGDRGRASNYAYGSAKGGFSTYLSGLRNRLFKSNVHVVTVKPGFINTKMTAHLELPKILTASPEQVAQSIYKAIIKKKNVIYVKWFWRYIMLIIVLIPESIFKKLKL